MSRPTGRHRAPRVVPLHAVADTAAGVPLRPVTAPDAANSSALDVDASDPTVLREEYRRLVEMYRRGVECYAELAQALDQTCKERDALARRVRELENKSNLARRLAAARMAAAMSQSKLARLQASTEPHQPSLEAGPS